MQAWLPQRQAQLCLQNSLNSDMATALTQVLFEKVLQLIPQQDHGLGLAGQAPENEAGGPRFPRPRPGLCPPELQDWPGGSG